MGYPIHTSLLLYFACHLDNTCHTVYVSFSFNKGPKHMKEDAVEIIVIDSVYSTSSFRYVHIDKHLSMDNAPH